MNLIVVGLGYVGLPVAVAACRGGLMVTGFDIDKEKVKKLRLGILDNPDIESAEVLEMVSEGRLKFEFELPKLTNSCTFIIAVPTPLNDEGLPEMKFLGMACDLIAKVVTDGSLIISESTSYVGTLRNFILPQVVQKSKKRNLDFAVAPERIDPGNAIWSLRNTPRVISGVTKQATQRSKMIYSTFCEKIVEVTSPEVAEAAKLLENTFRQVNIALVNELSEIMNRYEISTHEVINAASTKPYGFMPFLPSIGVGGHCIPVDPSYLIHSAHLVGLDTKIINIANEINHNTPSRIAQSVKEFLNNDLKGKIIQIAGIAYKPNVSDIRESPALEFISQLKHFGAHVIWHDPLVLKWNDEASTPLKSEIDLGIIVTPHNDIDFSIWSNSGVLVLDVSASTNQYGWPKFL